MSLLECSLSHLVTKFLVTSALLSLFLFNFNVSSPSWSESNSWIVGYASSTSEDVHSPVSKGFVSDSWGLLVRCYKAVPAWNSESNHPLSRPREHLMHKFLMTSVGKSAQESRIHCKMLFLGGAFKFPAAVSSWMPTVPSYSSYFSVHNDLNGLSVQLTFGVCVYLVQPPGTITRSIFLDFRESETLSSMWHS